MELTERGRATEPAMAGSHLEERDVADALPRLRIVRERPQNEEDPPRFAVVRGERRVAWGLRDRAAAQRWLKRLNAPVQAPLSLGA